MAENISNDDLSIQNLLVAYGAHMKRPRVEGSDASSTQIGKGIEKPIQLLGLIFEIRLRCPASPDVGQDFPSTGGHAERHVKFPSVSSGGQGLHTPNYAHGLKRMAHSEATSGYHMSPPTSSLPEGGRGIGPMDWQIQSRRPMKTHCVPTSGPSRS